jgi:genome maintenance exonuclease 1
MNLDLRKKYFIREELDFIELESYNENNKRFYKTPTGEKYPSVTTVLGGDKTWLYEWRKQVGEEEANRISRHASTRGTRLHKMCEKYMLNDDNFANKQMPLTIELFKSIQSYIDSVEVVYGNEIPLYSHELRTAGTTDVFCKIDGVNVILDFKTASKPKAEEDIESYFLQATTYGLMVKERFNIEVPKIVILIAIEGSTPQYFIKSSSKYETKVKEIFNTYHSKNEYKNIQVSS